MKVIVAAKELRDALAFIAKQAESGEVIPVLANVLLSASDGKPTLKATNLNVWASVSIPADVDAPGSALPNARILSLLVAKAPSDASVSMEMDSGSLTVRIGKSKCVLPCLDPADFPGFPETKNPRAFEIPAKELARLMTATLFAVSSEDTRYYLNGVYLHFANPAVLAAVATNGHVLSLAHVDLAKEAPELASAIVPTKSAETIAALCKGRDGDASVEIYTNHVRLRLPSGEEFLSVSIDETYPDYARILPRGNPLRAVVDKDSALRALASASVIAKDRRVKLSLSDGEANVYVNSEDSGSGRFPFDCEYNDRPVEIGFNPNYLASALSSLSTDTAIFRIADAGSPMMIQSRDSARDLIAIMPLRV